MCQSHEKGSPVHETEVDIGLGRDTRHAKREPACPLMWPVGPGPYTMHHFLPWARAWGPSLALKRHRFPSQCINSLEPQKNPMGETSQLLQFPCWNWITWDCSLEANLQTYKLVNDQDVIRTPLLFYTKSYPFLPQHTVYLLLKDTEGK